VTGLTVDTRHPLERLLLPYESPGQIDPGWQAETQEAAGVRCHSGAGNPEWLFSNGWRILATPDERALEGKPLLAFHTDQGKAFHVTRNRDHVEVPFSLAEAYENYVLERWVLAAKQRRLSGAALDVFYLLRRAIPRRVQLGGRRALMRWQGLPTFPQWPFDGSVHRLLCLYARCLLEALSLETLRFRWFWPPGCRAAVILTHDVESEQGLREAVRVADLEEKHGLRSSFNLVADWYPIDWGIVEELRGRGFELGVHGLFHDRSLFSDREQFEHQLPLLRRFHERIGADGFRSPATYRRLGWLGELPTQYDCTVPMSDPYEPQPGGCCSPWPFFIGPLVELPYTLPQDHTLFTLLRQRDIGLWADQLRALERTAGLVQCVTHPDPGYLAVPQNRGLYQKFLELVSGRENLWHALPRDIAEWWRQRDGQQASGVSFAVGTASVSDGPELAQISLN